MAQILRTNSVRSSNVAELTVSELSSAIKRSLEDTFGLVRLRGEISGYRGPHSSGHCYFALKDDKAKIEAVIWRGVLARLRFKPEEGAEVIVTGKVTSYPGSSKYQIVIETMEPAGIGALMALLEERKRKLAAEGLFAAERKRPLPFLPRVVGIVTSPTGAVIRDMLHGFAERFPTRVVVWPVRVQGETSASEVAAAIRGFNALAPGGPLPRPDVIIVARGGGSLEDLWGFNEEIVVRAAAESEIAIISAIGHETDWTLLDLVADARAPTPTKAAEWAVPKHSDLSEQVIGLALRLTVGARRTVEQARTQYKAVARALPRLQDLVALPRQRFDAVERRLARALGSNTAAHARRFARIAPRLQDRLVHALIDRRRQRLVALAQSAHASLARISAARRTRLERAGARLAPQMLRQRLSRAGERAGELGERLASAFANGLARRRQVLVARADLLASLSYQSVLARGFAVVRDEAGRTVRSVSGLEAGMRLGIELADGSIGADIVAGTRTVRGATTPAAGSPVTAGPQPAMGASANAASQRVKIKAPMRTVTRERSGSDDQGSLF